MAKSDRTILSMNSIKIGLLAGISHCDAKMFLGVEVIFHPISSSQMLNVWHRTASATSG